MQMTAITWHSEVRKLSDLKPFEGNPRQATEKQEKDLKNSIDKFNLAVPIIINTDNTIIGGHFRYRILLKNGGKEKKVDVRVPSKKLTNKEIKELNLRLNKNLGEWDFDLLADNFEIDLLEDVGFGLDDFKEINFPEKENLEEKDEIKVKKNEIWNLENHKIMCSSPLNQKNIKKLLNGQKADFILGYSPYIIPENISNFPTKKEITEKTGRIISFSGGKDSTAMLLRMLEKKMRIDEIIYFSAKDWDWEFIGKHFEQIEKREKIKITILESDKDWNQIVRERGFPSQFIRWCTGDKVRIISKYLKEKYDNDYIEYIGIAYDESNRAGNQAYRTNRNIKFPLIDWKMTEKDCLEYCLKKGYDWNGYYQSGENKEVKRLSCWCCPLQYKLALFDLWKNHPDKWNKLRKMQEESPQPFSAHLQTLYFREHQFWCAKYNYNNAIRLQPEKTSKIKFIKRFLKLKLPKNSLILDLYSGGEILFLCMELEHTCYIVEENPIFCNTLIAEWEKFTNQKAKLSTGS